MRDTARRRNGGQELRNALARTGRSYQDLAAAIRERDPEGRGVSFQLVGFLASKTGNARETASPETARKIEDALGADRGSLFDYQQVPGRGDPQPDWAEL